jgi:hypothetical protein
VRGALKNYRLYLDESGDHSSSTPENTGKRYLGLTGVIFPRGVEYDRFSDDMESLKRHFFPQYDAEDPPILHREDILHCRKPFNILRDSNVRRAFDRALLEMVSRGNYVIVTVVIDKYEHGHKSYRSLTHPYHYGLLAMMERYCGWLNFKNATGDIMAESRGGREDAALKSEYQEIFQNGEGYLKKERVQQTMTSKEIKIKPKEANIAGLQLADLLAHPLTRDVLCAFGKARDRGSTFAEEIVKAVTPKYNRQIYQDRIEGYGRVLLD